MCGLRYRFAEFVVSPRRRALLRADEELPLIPRYFDLLVFLIERRHEAVHRRDIFYHVWRDVIVSDSALSQAIRTLRRTLGDDSREPRFIRTVSRHGYRFVYADVVEETDDAGETGEGAAEPSLLRPRPEVIDAAPAVPADPDRIRTDPVEALIERLTRVPAGNGEEEEQREAAEILHGLGTDETLRRLGTRAGHERARAILRDTRWDAPGAGRVPILGAPGSVAAAAHLVRLRLRRVARIVAGRWAAAAIGGGAAGVLGGAAGGAILATAPTGTAPLALAAVLAVIGAACGAAGGAGVGAGLGTAEAAARSWRRTALIIGGAAGGAGAGALAQWLGRLTLVTLVGIDVRVGGAFDGLVLGAAAGLAYALGTRTGHGGLAAPRGARRWGAVLLMGVSCAAAAAMLTIAADRPLVGGTIHMIATASRGAQAALTPLGALVGEPDFGPLSRGIIGTGEGLLFGLGLGLGLTRRP